MTFVICYLLILLKQFWLFGKTLISLLVENTEEKLKVYRDNHQIWKAMFLDPRVMKAGFQNEPDKLKKNT